MDSSSDHSSNYDPVLNIERLLTLYNTPNYPPSIAIENQLTTTMCHSEQVGSNIVSSSVQSLSMETDSVVTYETSSHFERLPVSPANYSSFNEAQFDNNARDVGDFHPSLWQEPHTSAIDHFLTRGLSDTAYSPVSLSCPSPIPEQSGEFDEDQGTSPCISDNTSMGDMTDREWWSSIPDEMTTSEPQPFNAMSAPLAGPSSSHWNFSSQESVSITPNQEKETHTNDIISSDSDSDNNSDDDRSTSHNSTSTEEEEHPSLRINKKTQQHRGKNLSRLTGRKSLVYHKKPATVNERLFIKRHMKIKRVGKIPAAINKAIIALQAEPHGPKPPGPLPKELSARRTKRLFSTIPWISFIRKKCRKGSYFVTKDDEMYCRKCAEISNWKTGMGHWIQQHTLVTRTRHRDYLCQSCTGPVIPSKPAEHCPACAYLILRNDEETIESRHPISVTNTL